MKYAIVENGGKQYRAVEGSTIEVDRMDAEVGQQLNWVLFCCWSMAMTIFCRRPGC
jgi:ribosomal protein L21